MSKYLETFRQILANALSEHGSIKTATKVTGVSRGTLENWRDGKTTPSISDLERLEPFLKRTPPEMLVSTGAESTSDSSLSPNKLRLLQSIDAMEDEEALYLLGELEKYRALFKRFKSFVAKNGSKRR